MTHLGKIIFLTQVMCRENKGSQTYVSLTLSRIKHYLISSRDVLFRRKKSNFQNTENGDEYNEGFRIVFLCIGMLQKKRFVAVMDLLLLKSFLLRSVE